MTIKLRMENFSRDKIYYSCSDIEYQSCSYWGLPGFSFNGIFKDTKTKTHEYAIVGDEIQYDNKRFTLTYDNLLYHVYNLQTLVALENIK